MKDLLIGILVLAFIGLCMWYGGISDTMHDCTMEQDSSGNHFSGRDCQNAASKMKEEHP